MIDLAAGGLAIAFAGGVVSFASPCCLPLVPAYLSYMVGTTDGGTDRRLALSHGIAFVVGFSAIFVAFWASIGAIGYVLADNAAIMRQLGGALLIFLGLQVAGIINVKALWRDTRYMPVMGGAVAVGGGSGGGSGGTGIGNTLGGFASGKPSYGRSMLFGTLFAAGWSPCIGPILGGIIGLASVTESVATGTMLLIAYAAGLAVPFLAVALGAGWVSRNLSWVGRHHRGVNVVTGLMLVGLGILMVTNTFSRLAAIATPLG
ncbi:MAG: cytochrome c biogenesis CcdA family protein [Chloroflexota bacterium]